MGKLKLYQDDVYKLDVENKIDYLNHIANVSDNNQSAGFPSNNVENEYRILVNNRVKKILPGPESTNE